MKANLMRSTVDLKQEEEKMKSAKNEWKKLFEIVLMNFYRPEEFSHTHTHLRLSYCVTL